MYDTIENFQRSLIQHGKHSDRIYLMKLNQADMPGILTQLEQMARKNQYTKLFAKVPSKYKQEFESFNYQQEAYIPNFFCGSDDVSFMCKYFSDKRFINRDEDTINNVILTANSKYTGDLILGKSPYIIRKCTVDDASQIVEVYKEVFESYPFPIHDINYIIDTMNQHIIYYCVEDGDKVVALASSEEDTKNLNSEMTDFATLEAYRGKNLSLHLLHKMEQDLKARSFKTAYTIARSLSYSMNITFAKIGYKYSGTLINNTNICGALESMNVWYKNL